VSVVSLILQVSIIHFYTTTTTTTAGTTTSTTTTTVYRSITNREANHMERLLDVAFYTSMLFADK
jgi:hypothetical protein